MTFFSLEGANGQHQRWRFMNSLVDEQSGLPPILAAFVNRADDTNMSVFLILGRHVSGPRRVLPSGESR